MRAKVIYGGKPFKRFFIDEEEVSEEEFDANFPSKIEDLLAQPTQMLAAQTPSCWPMKSDALAVHPKQIPEALARNKAHGVKGVSYDPVDGRAILADRGARRDLMRLEQSHDNNGGYGDDHA